MPRDRSELSAPALVVAALRDTGRRCGAWIRAYCPYCDPDGRKRGDRTLAANDTWWQCHRCGRDAKSEREELERYTPQIVRGDVDADAKKLRQVAAEIVDHAYFLTDGDVVDKYLRARGLRPRDEARGWPTSLRRAELRHGPSRTWWPTMVAAVSNVGGEIVAVHRTFLDPAGVRFDDLGRICKPGGKAPVRPPRMALAPIDGHSIWLGFSGCEEEIVCTEGIESGLAASRQTGLPACALISANGMEKFVIPSCVKRIGLAYDRDPHGRGRQAMQVLARRAHERGLETWVPPLPRIGATDPADLIDVV